MSRSEVVLAVRASEVFPSPLATYTAVLGSLQAQAFSLLWQLPDNADQSAAVGTALEIIRRLDEPSAEIRIAPPALEGELSDGAELVMDRLGQSSAHGVVSGVDVEYIDLFLQIATDQHEILVGNLEVFAARF